jgi:predicted  nucleic acid-binding Zn-ribbon protein
VQDLIKKAVNLRTDLLDNLDERLSGVAKKLNLATRAELKTLKRQVRELENQVTSLEHQLAAERQRADRAEGSLSEAIKAQKKSAQTDLSDRMKLETEQKAAEAARANAEAALREATALKTRLEGELKAAEAARARAEEEATRSGSAVESTDEPDATSRKPRSRKKAEIASPEAASEAASE